MRFRAMRPFLVLVLVGLTATLTACTSGAVSLSPSASVGPTGFNAAVDNVIKRSSAQGGTLKLLSSTDCDSWDPARTYYGWCINMQRVFTRTLVGYSKVNGTSFTLAPDLATDLGTHNADYTEWTYTLQSGLKYSDGSAITAQDIKYAVERSYATDVITGGPGFYFTAIIDAPSSYKGPYTSGDLPNSAIDVEGNKITFHLKKSFADFNYLLALPTSAPVPKAKDTGANYTKDPVSSGPFTFTDYTPTKSVTFVRNKYWSQATDRIRTPHVNQITLSIDSNGDDIDDQLRTGAADARMDSPVGAAFQAEILGQARLRANADLPAGPALRFIAIPTSVPPFDNIHCRRAVFYAFNKAAAVDIAGGIAAGRVAHSAIPPGVLGFDPSYDPYPSGKDDTGDLVKARAELKACGRPDGFTAKYAYPTPDSTDGAQFAAARNALGRVGITLTAATAGVSDYFLDFVGSPMNVKDEGLGLINAGWGADYPTPFAMFQHIANGDAILQQGNSNYASIDIPTVNHILDATGVPSSQSTGESLDRALMTSAQMLPVRYSTQLWYRNPRLTNITTNNALGFGSYDVVNVGVREGR